MTENDLFIFTSSKDMTIKIWSLSEYLLIATIPCINSITDLIPDLNGSKYYMVA